MPRRTPGPDAALPRRRLICGLGATALLGAAAGCSSLPLGGDDPRASIPADALRAVVEDGPPTVPETVPVDVEPSYLDSAAGRVRETLAAVPAPFDPSEVPNGAIREELNHVHEHAVARLDAADAAPTPFEAMRALGRARGEASTLAAAWGAIERGLTRSTVAERAPAIEAAREDFLERWEYVGDDRLRAAVVHAVLERGVRSAGRNATVDSDSPEPENPLSVGELAGELARARAAVEDASYLYDRYAASLDRPADLRPALANAAATLVETVEERRRDVPSIDPTDPSALVGREVGGATAEVLESLYWRVESPTEVARALEEGWPATAVVRAHRSLAAFRALDAVRERVAGGESYEVETAADVGALRAAAVDAVESSRGSGRSAVLTNRVLADLVDRLRGVDRQLGRDRDSVPVDAIAYEASEYAVVAVMARALPPTSEAVARVLRSARG